MIRPQTLGALRSSGYRSRSVRDELRTNVIARLRTGQPLFTGIHGYDDTVLPQVVNAILARQDFILLGLRGQAKSRILRALTEWLDPEVPALAGTELNEDPLAPITREGRLLVEEAGDEAPLVWVPREARYIEKLATPDVTVADLIGDLDPIRAARGGHLLSDELTIHFGLLPRAHRGIFALNELPDLAGKIQVGLFNILQEGDIQIRGFPIRLPLDLLLVFSANPEDYTARGKIITPLKDRIGAEIRTHYPETLATGIEITSQEAWTDRGEIPIQIPPILRETVEQIAFIAREDRRIDQRSGVSQRMPITLLEAAVSSAEQRALRFDEVEAIPRVIDLFAALPAMTGKMELEYEGELQGSDRIARELIASAAQRVVEARIDLDDLEEVVAYFDLGGIVQLSEGAGSEAAAAGFASIPGLVEAAVACGLILEEGSPGIQAGGCELLLEALVAGRRISRVEGGGYGRSRRSRPSEEGGLGGSGSPFKPFEEV